MKFIFSKFKLIYSEYKEHRELIRFNVKEN